MRTVWFIPVILLLAAAAGSATAHEFWISPERYQIEAGDRMVASLRVGDKFRGPTVTYIPETFTRFEIMMGGQTTAVTGRLGDDPALDMAVPGTGLAVIVHETSGHNIRYMEWEKFEAFVRRKDFAPVLEQHKARGLRDSDFMEHYRRFAKSLVAVGDGRGMDQVVGMETEFVAEANPYTDAMDDGLPMRLFYQSKPRGDAQVEVFEKAPDGSVEISLLRTDGQGRVKVPVKPGHEYLLDAVVMRPLEAEDTVRKPVWLSLWAQFTFAVPGK